MKKTPIAILIILILISSYVITINLMMEISQLTQNTTGSQNENGYTCGSSSCEQIGVSDRIGIEITRNRWYGKIIINSNQERSSENLYLFNLIKLPLSKDGFSFVRIHILVVLISLIILVVALIWDISKGMRKTQKEEQEYYEL